MMLKPITPAEVRAGANKPDEVFESFNELIVKHWDGTGATFTVKEVVQMIARKTNTSLIDVMKSNHLDVNDAYRKAGWDMYEGSTQFGFGEIYDERFTFIPTIHFGEGS